MHMRTSGSFLTLAIALCSFTGCVEERVVAVRGGLQNLPGAVGGVRPDVAPNKDAESLEGRWDRILAGYGDPQADLEGTVERPRRSIDQFGNVTLILRSPSDVLWHLYWTIQLQEWDLLYEQVISERLKRNYVERFREPEDALVFIQRHRREVIAVLVLLPGAELTPGAQFRSIGPSAFRITVPDGAAKDAKFSSVDVIIEDGIFRLLLIN